MVGLGERKTGPIPERKRLTDKSIAGSNFSGCFVKWNQFNAGKRRSQIFRRHPVVVALHPCQHFAPIHSTDRYLHISAQFNSVK